MKRRPPTWIDLRVIATERAREHGVRWSLIAGTKPAGDRVRSIRLSMARELIDIPGATYRTVGQAMGVPTHTAYQRAQRAKRGRQPLEVS